MGLSTPGFVVHSVSQKPKVVSLGETKAFPVKVDLRLI
jgi:hypothetical protein